MTSLVWDKVDERTYENGVDQGVLYNENHTKGVVWNGLSSVEVSRVDSSVSSMVYDNIKYLDVVAVGDVAISLTSYTTPEELCSHLGEMRIVPGFYITRQPRIPFGLVYRTMISSGGYKLHLVYNASILSPAKSHITTQSNVEPSTFSFDIQTIPNLSTEYRPTSYYVVDSNKVNRANLDVLEDILFGSDTQNLIDGGPPPNQTRTIMDGGTPSIAGTIVIDGGAPDDSLFDSPTLPPIEDVMAILEGT